MAGSSSTRAMRRDMARLCRISPQFFAAFPLALPASGIARARNEAAHSTIGQTGDEAMQGKAEPKIKLQDAIGDLVELVAKAFFGGLGAAVAMSLAILALSATVQAATVNDAKAGTLLLRANGDLVAAPQVSTEVAIEVTGMVARTRVTQLFHNPGSDFVEGVYVFPLPEKAAVDRL